MTERMIIRVVLVLAGLELITQAGCSRAGRRCTEMPDSELVSGAVLVRYDVYRGSLCQSPEDALDLASKAGAPSLSKSAPLPGPAPKLDLPEGNVTLLVTTFSDLAGHAPLGIGCVEARVVQGVTDCIDLELEAVPLVCAADQTDCQMQCVDLTIDRRNCGACGLLCVGDEICAGGKCACSGALTDCEGHCVDASVDPNNCGSCGGTCPPAANCASGICSCNQSDFTNCGDVCVDLLSDKKHCGTCTSSCSGDLVCNLGTSCICSSTDWPWFNAAPAHRPGKLNLHAMAYDEHNQRVVLFGGMLSSGATSSDTWLWDGVDWTNAMPVDHPTPRIAPAMAYDPKNQNMVLFGGFDENGRQNDTWIWDGSDWTVQPISAGTPSARFYHAMAADKKRNIVMFGGSTGGVDPNTYAWDGTAWSMVAQTGPPATHGQSMVFESRTNRTLLFGGLGVDQTWTWDGSKWTQQNPAVHPSTREYGLMADDVAHHVVVLFGGGNSLNDTWLWDGLNWAQSVIAISRFPPGRSFHGLAYDGARAQTVLYGGMTPMGATDDTWLFDPSKGPTPCGTDSCVAFDSDSQNCGGCGTSCPTDGACLSGKCTKVAVCGAEAVDLFANDTHCGDCGTACVNGRVCQAGVCSCPGVTPGVCGGTCVDFASDLANCGSCGKVCSWACEQGMCSCDMDGITDCGDGCFDLQNSPSRCGTCTHSCTGAQTCVSGICQ